jgi:hypothetical protein
MKRFRAVVLAACAASVVGCGDTTSPNSTPTPTSTPTPVPVVADAVKPDRVGFSIVINQHIALCDHIDAGCSSVEWSSDAANVASVSQSGEMVGRSEGVTTVHVKVTGGRDTSFTVAVAPRTAAFTADGSGCPTAADVEFVNRLFRIMDFNADPNTSQCVMTRSDGVQMSTLKALIIRTQIALAGTEREDVPGFKIPDPAATSYFEWLAFSSKISGLKVVPTGTAAAEFQRQTDGTGVLLFNPLVEKSIPAELASKVVHEAGHEKFTQHDCPLSGGVMGDYATAEKVKPYEQEASWLTAIVASSLSTANDRALLAVDIPAVSARICK